MRRKKNDYRAFLKKSGFKAREGKQVSVSKETHDKVAMIVRWLGDGEVTMADFTENVVSEFLRTHRDELNRMFTSPSFRQPLMVEPEKLVATMPASSMPSLW